VKGIAARAVLTDGVDALRELSWEGWRGIAGSDGDIVIIAG
jgi:hypothetical protein